MPAFILLGAMLLASGATAVAIYLLGDNASEQRKECVEKMTEALEPRTVDGVKDIVTQCKKRYPE